MNKKKITVIDYGVGNLLSLKRAFEKIDADVIITNNYREIINSSSVVLPGVGAFENAMKAIKNLNLIEPIKIIAEKGVPLLGICLGAQLLLSKSEEFGIAKGIDIIKGEVKNIKTYNLNKQKIIIPHIGWGNIISKHITENKKNKLFTNITDKDFFYFVHSFVCKPYEKKNILYETSYGEINLTAIHGNKNVYGFQFHPEKSGLSGLKLLKNFVLL